jgi:hypothetical protein
MSWARLQRGCAFANGGGGAAAAREWLALLKAMAA